MLIEYKIGINKNLKKFAGKYSVHIGSVDNLPFKNNYFDFVNCSGVLHHPATKHLKKLGEF